MGVTDELLANNRAYAGSFGHRDLPLRPARRLAVLACMDSRLDVFGALGLEVGEAHVVRNAGGLATDDVLRSLALSQRLMGTEEIIVIHHLDCGVLRLNDDEFKRQLREEVGTEPSWSAHSTGDVEENVRRAIDRIATSPFIPRSGSVRGFVYDEATGRLREVT
jgi:carbonic anhydrase